MLPWNQVALLIAPPLSSRRPTRSTSFFCAATARSGAIWVASCSTGPSGACSSHWPYWGRRGFSASFTEYLRRSDTPGGSASSVCSALPWCPFWLYSHKRPVVTGLSSASSR
jgi:hypothetical protein